jgi:hypothetical protein
VIPICLPKVGQKFRNLDDAWLFWVNYGGHAGFKVRKMSSWTSKMDGKVTSCRYVCAKEGRRAQDKSNVLIHYLIFNNMVVCLRQQEKGRGETQVLLLKIIVK